MTIKSTRASRKSKVASTTETSSAVLGADISGSRLFSATLVGITAHVTTSFTVMSLISTAISLPTLSGAIWLLGVVLTLLAAIAAGTWVSNRVVSFILDKHDLAVIRTARQLFNFRNEVTA